MEYRFHDGARSSLMIVAVLCFVLIAAVPIGMWLLFRRSAGKVRITASGLAATGLYGSTTFEFADVARLGLLEVPVVARGIGGALARRRVGGDKAIYLVVQTHSGKTRKFIVSSYEKYEDIIRTVSKRTQKALEHMKTGLFGPKWPGDA